MIFLSIERKGTKMETTGLNYNPHAMIELKDLSSGEEKFAYFKAIELEGMKEKIQRLESTIQSYSDQVIAVRDLALENIDDIDNDFLTELANILHFELKREYQVAVQIEYVFTVKAKDESEVQDIIDGLDIPRLSDEAIEDSYVWGEVIDHSYDEV